MYHAIQYQDFLVQKRDRVSQTRAVSFPKILILEQIGVQCQPITTFIRIYERENLDHDLTVHELNTSSLVYIFLEGFHVSKDGAKVDDMAASVEIEEIV